MTNEQLVSKVWNYAHVLRDQGIWRVFSTAS